MKEVIEVCDICKKKSEIRDKYKVIIHRCKCCNKIWKEIRKNKK